MTAEKLHDALTLLPADLIAETDEMRCRKPKIIQWKRYAAMAASLAFVLFCGALLSGRLLPRMGSMKTEQAACEMAPAEAAPMLDAAVGMEETQAAGTVSGNGTPSLNRAESTAEEAPAATEQELCSLPTVPATENPLPEFGWDTENDPGDVPQPIACDQYSTPSNPNSAVNIYSDPNALVLTSRTELDAYIEDHAAAYDFSQLEENLYRYDESWFEKHDMLLTVVHSAHTGEDWTVTAIKDAAEINEKGWDWYILISHPENLPNNPETNYHLLTPLENGLISPESHILNIKDTSGEPIK